MGKLTAFEWKWISGRLANAATRRIGKYIFDHGIAGVV
jgi:hypothetical protein